MRARPAIINPQCPSDIVGRVHATRSQRDSPDEGKRFFARLDKIFAHPFLPPLHLLHSGHQRRARPRRLLAFEGAKISNR